MEHDRLVYLTALSKIFAFRCKAGRRLIESFSDLETLFRVDRDTLEALLPGQGGIIDSLLDRRLIEWAEGEVEWAWRYGIELIPIGSGRYPSRLAECDDAPLLLYYKGTANLNAQRVLAVVGTRRATYYGRESCKKIIENLALSGACPLIVSGMALGIDGTAHLAALDAGLETVGVLPCGMDEIYPARHRELAKKILEKGALVTDFARATAPVALTFIRRNRIIAGMADAVLLAESFEKGGGLITARLAREYDREVFALPGRLSDPSFRGCNDMIAKNVAEIVSDVSSIGSAMGWNSRRKRAESPELFATAESPAQKAVIEALTARSPSEMDCLASATGLNISELSTVLLELEMKGTVINIGSNKYEIS